MPDCINMPSIHLYLPFYTPKDDKRFEEIVSALRNNLKVKCIDRIFLLIDDDSLPPKDLSGNVEILKINTRPTYSDWLNFSGQLSMDAISILANSDIFFDESLSNLEKVFESSGTFSFVALSRYEVIGDQSALHTNPKWSQDSWAIFVNANISSNLINSSGFELGTPRCDNKIAAVFAEYGYKIFNPCHHVKSYHLHESGIRNYDSNTDTRIMGSTVWVQPSEALTTPSELHLDYWTLNSTQIKNLKVNDTFSQIFRNSTLSTNLIEQNLIVAYDTGWQFPAITEKHAYRRLLEVFQFDRLDESIKYFAFPWASYIYLKKNNSNSERLEEFEDALIGFKAKLKNCTTLITVCQHIRMLEFQDSFADLGITDVFWSHAVKGQYHFPDYKQIRIHPFPLFPVHAQSCEVMDKSAKKHLFSFVGAKSAPFYLTESRNHIIESFSSLPFCYVKGRDSWHYNKIVYDHQIRRTSHSDQLGHIDYDQLLNKNHGIDFLNSLKDSIFSLCPSGSGPNSIRLWESIGLGAIPVILADTLNLPGDHKLWKDACVFCKETKSDILKLPEYLKKLSQDKDLIAHKKNLLRQLWFLYGYGGFVSDIKEFILAHKSRSLSIDFMYKLDSRDGESLVDSDQVSGGLTANAFVAPSRCDFPTLMALNSFILLHPESAYNFIKSNYTWTSRLYDSALPEWKAMYVKLNSKFKLHTSFWKNAEN